MSNGKTLVKCKVVLLPTGKAQQKHDIVVSTSSLYISETNMNGISEFRIPHYMYIISDAEIVANDYVYECCDAGDADIKEIHKAKSVDNIDGWIHYSDVDISTGLGWCKKVIASTDPSLGLPRPSNPFIYKYCEIEGINEVNVVYHDIHYCPGCNRAGMRHCPDTDTCGGWVTETVLKVAPDNTITIKRIKENYTKEEVIVLLRAAYIHGQGNGALLELGLERDEIEDYISSVSKTL